MLHRDSCYYVLPVASLNSSLRLHNGPRPMQETFEVPPVRQYSLATVKICQEFHTCVRWLLTTAVAFTSTAKQRPEH